MGRKMRGVEARGTSIRIGFMWMGNYCREPLKLPSTPANMRYADRLRAEILRKIELGTFIYADYFPDSPHATMLAGQRVVYLGRYVEDWLDKKRHMVKASTYKDYQKMVAHQISPRFADTRLDKINTLMIRDWLLEIGVSQKRASNLVSPIRMALDDAVEEGLIERNPLNGWRMKIPRRTPPAKPDPFSSEEQAAILDVVGRRFDSQIRNLIQFWLWTGLRTSELIALEWSDIDWHKGEVSVSKAITQGSDEAEGTKTRAGTRMVKLLQPAVEALQAQKSHTFMKDSRIWENPRTNAPWAGDQAIRRTVWTPALKMAGIRYRPPYQCRHTYGSMMLSAGEPVAWVSRQMGHSSVAFTLQTYATWVPDSMPDVGSRAVAIFGKPDKAVKAGRLSNE